MVEVLVGHFHILRHLYKTLLLNMWCKWKLFHYCYKHNFEYQKRKM